MPLRLGLKIINNNCTRQVVLYGLGSGLEAKDYRFFSLLFDYSFDYFLTVKLRPGRPNLVTLDHLKTN